MLTDVLAWIEPHAVLLALVLPAVIRVVGHWLPEELFMIAVGMLASRRPPAGAAVLLGAAWLGHFLTDQAVYSVGRAVMTRLLRRERVRRHVAPILERIHASPRTLWSLIPARVLPLGRGAWLLAAGGARVPRWHFMAVDALAVTMHVVLWCGLGWVVEDGAEVLAESGKLVALWTAVAVAAAAAAVFAWRRSAMLRPLRLWLGRGRGY